MFVHGGAARRRSLCGVLCCAAAFAQQPLFDAPYLPLPDGERFAALLDIDADGALDAVSVVTTPTNPLLSELYTTTVRVRRGDGAGRFLPPTTIGVVPQPTVFVGNAPRIRAFRARLNADAFDDCIVVAGTRIAYGVADGAGGASFAAVRDLGASINVAAAADFDGDGIDDVCVNTVLGFAFVPTDPIGFLAPPQEVFFFPAPGPVDLCAGELTGDGVADLAVLVAGSYSDTTTTVWTFLGAAPALQSAHGIGTFVGSSIVAGDPDGDGDVDLVVSGVDLPSATGHFLIRRYTPFVLGLVPTVIPSAKFLALADFDADGDADGLGLSVTLGNGVVEVSENVGGAFLPAATYPYVGATSIPPIVADLGGDGVGELLAARTVRLRPSVDFVPISFAGTSAAIPYGVVDVDGDGDPDLDVALGGGLTRRANDGSGAFSIAPLTPPPPGAGMTYSGPGLPGDWDGDGDVDFLLERRLVSGAYVDTRLLKNLGGGDFFDAGPATTDPTRLMFTTTSGAPLDRAGAFPADVEGDGDLDLVTSWRESTWDADITRVWINSGFGELVHATTRVGVRTLAVLDVDADGMADLIQTGQDVLEPAVGAPASIRRGMGLGTFFQATPLTFVPPADVGRSAADFDGDGDVDLPYFSPPAGPGSALRIAWGDGAGGFPTSTEAIPGEQTPGTAAPLAGDVNGDGLFDLVVKGAASSAVARGIGGGAFAVDEALIRPNALVDVDGDGDLDAIGEVSARGFAAGAAAGGVRRQFGASWRGAPGEGPVLGATGPFRAGSTAVVLGSRAPGGAAALFSIGLQSASEPSPYGGDLWVTPALTFSVGFGGPLGVDRAGKLALSFAAPPEFAGATFYSQLFAVDPASPSGFGVSNGLQLTFGGP
jgi:hypothetical protein